MSKTAEYVDGVLNCSGQEEDVRRVVEGRRGQALYLGECGIDFGSVRSAFCVALHMHQPLIPAGGGDLRHADLISNLQYMMENQHIGDNHNAPVFHQCYKRMGWIIPDLVREGKQPRVMLEYSGTLLHGLRKMGLHDVFDTLRPLTLDPQYRRCVEWLGCPWGHAVAPSTPIEDYRLHVLAWQQHFAALFGWDALRRVKGFSPSEMALPNHPDVAYAFVKTLNDCGYEWLLVQEHTVEQPNGQGVVARHLPHRLVCRSSSGDEASIVALIKTQGSDTKLVGQMQPYYEAKGLSRLELGGKRVPPIVTQIADGENGGVMMNEFPPKYIEVMRECSGSDVAAVNGGEYLEYLSALGVKESDLPVIQPLHQSRLWARFSAGDGGEKLNKAIEDLKREDHRFHMEGGSWTNNISWVRGYQSLLDPMEKVSALFNDKLLKTGAPRNDNRFRTALFLLMCSQTSCYRYWGQGQWTDYGREICRRLEEVLQG